MYCFKTSSLLWACFLSCLCHAGRINRRTLTDVVRRQSPPVSNITRDFEVSKPISVPTGSICATQTLMVHSFGSSYGVPFVSEYTPPGCDFNSVVINFTATSAGVQFDRLAMMYLTDTEVWRTSTAEPTKAGIVWTYVKDMSAYLSLWKQPQTVIFELDNIVDSTYTGHFNTTLTATFFARDDAAPAADVILPISSRQGGAGKQSVFMVPDQNATVSYAGFARNVTRATVSVSANGQINEEFWYTNVFTSQTLTFNSTAGELLGGGPFREVQLLIDGYLAGVVWPYPVIFTGGVAPGFWRPVVGIQAFDLHESEIDITLFVPLLTDGNEHTFTIRVCQLADTGGNGTATLTEVEEYWLVTGKIFLFHGHTQPADQWAPPQIIGADPTISISSSIMKAANGTNETLTYTTTARRSLTVYSSSGTWIQDLSYHNTGELSSGGFVQTSTQLTNGTQTSIHPAGKQEVEFSYPITVTTSYAVFPKGGIHIDAALKTGLQWKDSGRADISTFTSVAGPSALDTSLEGTAHYSSVTNASYSFGTTEQKLSETSYGTTYNRDVKAVNGTIVSDTNPDGGGSYGGVEGSGGFTVQGAARELFGGARGMIGRGPGSLGKGL
ncbi:putative peptide-n4-asparaginase amidase n [Diplogelasinospora grovesii]|uniref:Peptide-n4-asparaginase amidase n n=1 Tax=Diplogelasinospora grovesii TaxID=303347 RepID=A0AAN6S5R3_9PEZI|nr:putative peptide-n4-asparaginase amidase n [Diplogelasinospora grovesii]